MSLTDKLLGMSDAEKEDYARQEREAHAIDQADEEWNLDFPWLDYISTCNFSNPIFQEEFAKAII